MTHSQNPRNPNGDPCPACTTVPNLPLKHHGYCADHKHLDTTGVNVARAVSPAAPPLPAAPSYTLECDDCGKLVKHINQAEVDRVERGYPFHCDKCTDPCVVYDDDWDVEDDETPAPAVPYGITAAALLAEADHAMYVDRIAQKGGLDIDKLTSDERSTLDANATNAMQAELRYARTQAVALAEIEVNAAIEFDPSTELDLCGLDGPVAIPLRATHELQEAQLALMLALDREADALTYYVSRPEDTVEREEAYESYEATMHKRAAAGIAYRRQTASQSADAKPCGGETHYGEIGPINRTDPKGPTGWHGLHGAPTANPSGLCDDCEQEYRDNFPHHHGLPTPLTFDTL